MVFYVYILAEISDNAGFKIFLDTISMISFLSFLAKIQSPCRRLKAVLPPCWKMFRLSGKAFRDLWMDGGFTQAAAISYYLVVSIFPMLLLLIGVAGFFIKPEDLQGEMVLSWLTQYFPKGTRAVFRDNIQAIFEARSSISIFGSIVLLWSSSLMFDAINQAVNAAWGMRGNARFVLDKLKSLLLICVIATAALFSIFFTTHMAIINRFGTRLEKLSALEWPVYLGREALALTGMIIPLFLSVLAFGLAYRLLPRVTISIRDVWPAALSSAVLWELSKTAFVWYLAKHTEYKQIYGSISAVLVLMLWAYVSSLILAWGAELTSEIWKDRYRTESNKDKDYPFIGVI